MSGGWRVTGGGNFAKAEHADREAVIQALLRIPTVYWPKEEARPLLKPGQFHELRYEDLTRNPMGELAKVYEALELGGFDAVKPRVEEYLRQTTGYETNKYELTAAQRAALDERWGEVIRRYGYA